MADALRTDEIQGEIVHVYDGIEEADNELPTWWLWTFYGAIVFSVLYWFAYHEFEAVPLPAEQYAAALQAQSSGGDVSAELLTALAADPSAVAVGAELYAEHCVVCHKERGEGNIGPNLTDAFWLHGGSPTDIHGTIYDGVLQNGMPAWGGTLGAASVQKITAFVLSIQNTDIPGKEPQGERYDPNAEEGSEPPVDSAEDPTEATAQPRTQPSTQPTEAEPAQAPDV
ncbi:MAG: cbb3-type cytochrome c oxidase N-terminal domain-containing protein [Myxococcota bacterium]